MFVFFYCSHWSLVDVPLIFFCPADHVPDWQPRVLLGMVEARSVNVKKTTTTTTSMAVDVVDKGSKSSDDLENEFDGVQNVETTGSDEKKRWHVDLALHIKM